MASEKFGELSKGEATMKSINSQMGTQNPFTALKHATEKTSDRSKRPLAVKSVKLEKPQSSSTLSEDPALVSQRNRMLSKGWGAVFAAAL